MKYSTRWWLDDYLWSITFYFMLLLIYKCQLDGNLQAKKNKVIKIMFEVIRLTLTDVIITVTPVLMDPDNREEWCNLHPTDNTLQKYSDRQEVMPSDP